MSEAEARTESASTQLFISWSGSSKAVAQVLRDWIEEAFSGVKPFQSGVDIAGGSAWLNTINDELRSAKYGIICVAPDNLDAPWLNFEAGALAARLQKVTPLLLNVSVEQLRKSRHPLSDYTARSGTRGDILKLFQDIDRVTKSSRTPEVLSRSFDRIWGDGSQFSQALERVPASIPAGGNCDIEHREALAHLLFDSPQSMARAAVDGNALLNLPAPLRIGLTVVHPEAGVGRIVEILSEEHVTVEIGGVQRTLQTGKLRLAAFRGREDSSSW